VRIVLLSGGTGKRLWPLSNDSRSKQFLKVLKNMDNQFESMVQRVWRQISNYGHGLDAYVVTNQSQVEMIQNQLGEQVKIIVEPSSRDTFPAISLASLYLHYVESVSKDETIIVSPVDPYVNDDFFYFFDKLDAAAQHADSEIVLLGVKPTGPSEKYGYIVPKEKCSKKELRKVKCFVEKPDQSRADQLIGSGALWNCGVFAFRLGYLLALINKKYGYVDYLDLLQHYNSKLPKISFDYEVVEKAQNVHVIEYPGTWKDIGTWNALTEEMNTNTYGNVYMSQDTTNTHVINELEVPITVLGCKDMIVVATYDGILVSEKDASQRLKEVMKNYSNIPMYVERLWGNYKIVDFVKTEVATTLTKRVFIKEAKNLSYHVHYKRTETWTIVSGQGIVVIDDRMIYVGSGDSVHIKPGQYHSIKALKDLEFIEVQCGEDLANDIERKCLAWDDVMEHLGMCHEEKKG